MEKPNMKKNIHQKLRLQIDIRYDKNMKLPGT